MKQDFKQPRRWHTAAPAGRQQLSALNQIQSREGTASLKNQIYRISFFPKMYGEGQDMGPVLGGHGTAPCPAASVQGPLKCLFLACPHSRAGASFLEYGLSRAFARD